MRSSTAPIDAATENPRVEGKERPIIYIGEKLGVSTDDIHQNQICKF